MFTFIWPSGLSVKRLKCEKRIDTDDDNDRDRCKMMKIFWNFGPGDLTLLRQNYEEASNEVCNANISRAPNSVFYF